MDKLASFFNANVSCGFPSPADEYLETQLDLNTHLVHKPAATFFVRASGDSMIGAGIYNSDILIVDRSLTARHGHVVLAILNGEFTVKRYLRPDPSGAIILQAENKNYKPIPISPESDFQIWGVVTYCLHSLTQSFSPSMKSYE